MPLVNTTKQVPMEVVTGKCLWQVFVRLIYSTTDNKFCSYTHTHFPVHLCLSSSITECCGLPHGRDGNIGKCINLKPVCPTQIRAPCINGFHFTRGCVLHHTGNASSAGQLQSPQTDCNSYIKIVVLEISLQAVVSVPC